MTLDKFIEESHEQIEKFKAEWLRGMKDAPENYPLDMPEGEWDEQFLAFMEW